MGSALDTHVSESSVEFSKRAVNNAFSGIDLEIANSLSAIQPSYKYLIHHNQRKAGEYKDKDKVQKRG